MGRLRRLSRWIGVKEKMTPIVGGDIAPEFSLRAIDGEEYSLGARAAHGLVVATFFKISCPVCQFTFPFLQRLHKRYGGDGVTFVGISQDDARATKEFCREYGITFRILLDEKGYPVSNRYGLTTVPTIFLIDPGGAVKVSCQGFNKKDLETIAAELTQRRNMACAPLFRPDELIPALKPG